MAIADEFNDTFGHLLLKGFLLLVDIALFSGIVMFLWNYLAPILGLVTLSYKSSIAVFLLSRFLLKDHLLSPDPIIVHCDCENEPKKEENKTPVATNCICGHTILSTDNFCEKCGLKQ